MRSKQSVLFFSLLLLFYSMVSSAKVRSVNVDGDQVVTVKTSIGIATIIQVPDRPNSVVVGDQDSFKVEYLDQAITIKPLVAGAKSNLYVYTDWHRYNVELISGPQGTSDYVVYLKRKLEKKKSVHDVYWRPHKNFLRNGNIELHVTRLGVVNNNLGLVEFKVSSAKAEQIDPGWLWLSQNGAVRPIQNLVLSALTVGPNKPTTGLLQLRFEDFDKSPLRLEVRRKKTSYFTLPSFEQWKQ